MDELYGLPLDEFTPRRDALAKELRGSDRDAAAWVKALKKPSAAAWLVNQLARTQRSDARRVLDSSDALRDAQERILAGKGAADELGRASEEHARAMRGLLSKAPGLLDSKGGFPSAATLDRAADTLRAIPLDEEARAGFGAGRLTREHQASGLGFVAGGEPVAPAAPRARTAKGQPAAEAEKGRKAQARATLKEARSRHRAQEKQVAELERALGQAEREAESARRRLEKAADALERARAKRAETHARVEEAEAAAKRVT